MSETLDKIGALIGKWRSAGLDVRDAIASSDFDKCRRADTAARAVYASLVEILDPSSAEGLKAEILEAAEIWKENVKAMPAWLDSTKQEIDSVRQRISSRRKLGGVYSRGANGAARSGQRLKIKAR